jgi:hypothetical protein
MYKIIKDDLVLFVTDAYEKALEMWNPDRGEQIVIDMEGVL